MFLTSVKAMIKIIKIARHITMLIMKMEEEL